MTDLPGGAIPLGPPPRGPAPDVPVFVISVAAELTGLHPQTLRTYDRLGLVTPGRTGGGGRRYSLRDLDALRVVAHLTAEGLGLEGVRRVLELEQQVQTLHERVAMLESELVAAHQALAETPNLPVPVTAQTSQVVVWRRG
ncbi:helix-turn-helix transcriptional regulator [soil metagenome]